jgi:hypothetical protein
VIDRLPDVQMLDADPQGWALARSVRDSGTIVDFVLVYINDAGCRLVGRPRGELVGGRYRELWPETVHDGTLPCTGRWWRRGSRRLAAARKSGYLAGRRWVRTHCTTTGRPTVPCSFRSGPVPAPVRRPNGRPIGSGPVRLRVDGRVLKTTVRTVWTTPGRDGQGLAGAYTFVGWPSIRYSDCPPKTWSEDRDRGQHGGARRAVGQHTAHGDAAEPGQWMSGRIGRTATHPRQP